MNNKEKKVLFLIPGFFYIEEYQERLYFNDLPLGTLQLSSFLRERANIQSQILDVRVEREKDANLSGNKINLHDFERSLLKVLERENMQEYNYVGINCYTSFQYLQTIQIGKIIRMNFPEVTLVVGGYHPSAVPEDFNYLNSPFDFIIQGEGELILLNLLKSSSHHKTHEKKNPEILCSKELVDVNTLPFPDYELYLDKYPEKNKYKFEFYMSRGCPYQCAFCAKNYPFRSYRYETFESHFQKLCSIVENINPNLPKIGFADQSFDRVAINDKVLDYILQNQLQDKFLFSCQCRVENLSQDLPALEKCKKCNMIIGFGFESASKQLLQEMHKTDHPQEYIEGMAKILNAYKTDNEIHCRLNLLCGFPGEDHNTFEKTVEFTEKYALHENIQISPSLFSNYPNVFVYENMPYYEQKFGTEFIKSWWKLEMNPMKTSVPEKPSRDYTKKDLLTDYIELYAPLLKTFKRQPTWDLIRWKHFYNNWLKEISLIH